MCYNFMSVYEFIIAVCLFLSFPITTHIYKYAFYQRILYSYSTIYCNICPRWNTVSMQIAIRASSLFNDEKQLYSSLIFICLNRIRVKESFEISVCKLNCIISDEKIIQSIPVC